MMTEALLLLSSGQTLTISGVTLFPESQVREIAQLKAQAQVSLGGVSTGLGFIGSPGWVLGGAAALGLLEGALSRSAKAKGVELLKAVEAKMRASDLSGVDFTLSDLRDRQIPNPQAWYAFVPKKVDFSHYNWAMKDQMLKRYGKSKSDLVDGALIIEERYIHSGDDFVLFRTNVGSIKIRWSYVAGYHCVDGSPSALAAADVSTQLR